MATKKRKWKAKTKEEKEEELNELIELSNKKIKEYQEKPENLLEYTRFMAKLHNYSPLNASLIDEQFQGATAVGSFQHWKKEGFQVNKGEKGIGIYVYSPITLFTDENGEQKPVSKASYAEKKAIENGDIETNKIKHFKKGYVFDVSQTNATEEDLPKIFPNKIYNLDLSDQYRIDDLKKGIDSIAETLDIDLVDMKDAKIGELGAARGAYVQYVDGSDEIALNSRNSETQNLVTAIHELAHRSLHQSDTEGADYSTQIKEYQAEMVAHAVSHNYGIDTSKNSIRYIANWTKNNDVFEPNEFLTIMKQVKETSVAFIDTMDEQILVERLKIEEIKMEKEQNRTEDISLSSQKNPSDNEIIDEANENLTIRDIVINQTIYNLKEEDSVIDSADEWIRELDEQLGIESITDLTYDEINVDDFYQHHKQEIEHCIDDVEDATGVQIRTGESPEAYKAEASVIAYRTVAAMMKEEVVNKNFEFPFESELKAREREQDLEMA